MLCKEIKIDTIYGIIVEDNMYVLLFPTMKSLSD